jgi:hypothetical protein
MTAGLLLNSRHRFEAENSRKEPRVTLCASWYNVISRNLSCVALTVPALKASDTSLLAIRQLFWSEFSILKYPEAAIIALSPGLSKANFLPERQPDGFQPFESFMISRVHNGRHGIHPPVEVDVVDFLVP